MKEEKINKIANELAKRIEDRFSRAKKLMISSVLVKHKASTPFREKFDVGFYVAEHDSIVLYFYSITEVSASVISSNPYTPFGSAHQFIDVKSNLSYEEAREVLNRVKEILSQKFEIEYYYYDDDDDYYYDE